MGTKELIEEAEESAKEDLQRQAAILEAQVNILKDQNHEFEEATINLQKIAQGQQREIEAAARLDGKNGAKQRVVLRCRWNEKHSDWEVAIHRSLQLISMKVSACTEKDFRNLIVEDLPTRVHILGRMESTTEGGDSRRGNLAVDFRPILLVVQEAAVLKGDLVWMPWQVVETIPCGLLGGEHCKKGMPLVAWLPTVVSATCASLFEEKLMGESCAMGILDAKT
ncbi:hypothetical protein CBR_g54317 [Chara braunii]|uniref:Uncharacterized protein n=1 Tax=Chara braunii TaxID=69332 RepID=A0A388MC61_CHABU|nr:hypothetical protein CBR_g54317 [Chara braunii]|eukprot:GBG92062.1 hypothetical protein CBR_g54317 [Chara braunii]